MGGVDSVLAAQETRQSLRLEKAAFLCPQTRRGCRFLICGAVEFSPSSSSNTSAVFSDEEYGAVEERVCEAGRKGHEEHRLPALAATWMNQADRSFRRHTCDEAARCLGQNVEELNINPHPSDANA
ncbi:hypothetical protein GWK47_044355 [Chionoecetes opilio]|uniref:Uncharacterized protein n=1 Tax=Chionoecetes opilio TaxID=41210 RepID=A0A8J4YF52_CHIOP|nr:hypothetical protein GWK47_044355 [Chionoecetes opilio]